ncbi:MAG: hypothetical protein ACKV2T_23660 [Kofleriaceae bacterium]
MRAAPALLVIAAVSCGRLDFEREDRSRPAHVSPGTSYGSGVLVIDTSVVVDTDSTVFPIALPTGATYSFSEQAGGPELAVLAVGDLVIVGGVTVRAIGTRPFVIVAGGDVTVSGVIDAGARRDVPGAGGAQPNAGPGAGANGTRINSGDSGGGGAGFATEGARGGNSTEPVVGAAPGPRYGTPDLQILIAGSGGGVGQEASNCVRVPPGAGGGAIQISAIGAIEISGGINVGGGGGGRADSCGGNSGAGGGGGSGGAIYLEAETIENFGVLAASGGSGGSGGDDSVPGTSGVDGALDMQSAPGAPRTMSKGSPGGNGGARDVLPTQGAISRTTVVVAAARSDGSCWSRPSWPPEPRAPRP